MSNLQDLKKMIGSVPDHKMNHTQPIAGPLREKKTEMAHKMEAPKKITMAELKSRHDAKYGKRSEAETKQLHKDMASAPGVDHNFKSTHQSRIGRSYND